MTVGRDETNRQVLHQIREKVDLIEIVSRYVTLTKAGQNFKGLCPFHSEKTPSFSVNPQKQLFHCFGCKAGGDVFAFLMKKEGLTFPEALAEMARQTGIPLPSSSKGSRSYVGEDNRSRLESLHALARTWYQNNLLELPVGERARQYLSGRNITSDTIRDFGLGYAPPQWDGLTKYLLQAGYTREELVRGGLAIAKDNPAANAASLRGCYDRFRGRIIFPIANAQGRVIAFGGRVLEHETPKYLNSPETPIFSKGRCLFGLDRAGADIRRSGAIVVVEGYFDVIALHQAGVTCSVAPLGTALTKDHVDVILRLAKTVYLVFDGDPAGVGAALRSLDVFLNSGLHVKVVVLPLGEDPDSFIRGHGNDEFHAAQARAVSLVDFAVDQCLQGVSTDRTDDRLRSIDEVLRIVGKASNPIEREEYIRQIGERLHIPQRLLVERYRALHPRRSVSKGNPTHTAPARSWPGGQRVAREERDLVSLFLQGALSPDQLDALSVDDFTVPVFRRVIEAGLRHRDAEGTIPFSAVMAEVSVTEEDAALIAELSVVSVHCEDAQAYIQGCLDALKRKRITDELDRLIMQLKAAEKEHQWDDIKRLNAAIDTLRERKAGFLATLPHG